MSLTVPLSVRLQTSTKDIHVTDEVAELTFSNNSPGGYDTCTMTLHRPLRVMPGELTLFGRVYVYAPTGLVWEGRLQDPGRAVDDDGEVWQLAAVGGQAHMQDRSGPYIVIDSSIDRLERRQGGQEHVKGDKEISEDNSGNPAVWLKAGEGQSWVQFQTATLVYPHIRNAQMKLGAYSCSGVCGRITAGTWKWQTVTRRSSDNLGTVDRNLDFTMAGFPSSTRTVGVSFPEGDDQLDLRIQSSGAATQLPGDDTWGIFAFFWVAAKLMTKAGVEKSVANNGYLYTDYFLAQEVVEDLLGRFLPELDGANARVDATTYHIEQLAYPDGVTPLQVLEDLLALEPAYTWHVWESNAAGLFSFEWLPWPTTVRYIADVTDGFSSPASGNTLFNQVRVRYRDANGRPRFVSRTQTVPELTAAGINRIHYIDLGDEVGSAAAATQAGDQFLAEHAAPLNAGRLTVKRPILDVQAGRMVQPWEIRAGSLIRVSGVESYPDSLSRSGRDGITIFKVAAATYTTAEASATLDLDSYAPSVARALAELKKKPAIRRR